MEHMNGIVLTRGSSVFVKPKFSWIWIFKTVQLCRWLIAFIWVWQLPPFSIMLYVNSHKHTVFMVKLKQLNISNFSMAKNPRRQKHLSSLIWENTALTASRQRAMFSANSVFFWSTKHLHGYMTSPTSLQTSTARRIHKNSDRLTVLCAGSSKSFSTWINLHIFYEVVLWSLVKKFIFVKVYFACKVFF